MRAEQAGRQGPRRAQWVLRVLRRAQWEDHAQSEQLPEARAPGSSVRRRRRTCPLPDLPFCKPDRLVPESRRRVTAQKEGVPAQRRARKALWAVQGEQRKPLQETPLRDRARMSRPEQVLLRA